MTEEIEPHESRPDLVSPSDKTEMLKLCVDLYKHHFELWLKAYAVYLAIVGTTAGFIFSEETPPDKAGFLMIFVVTVSAVAGVAWPFGLWWAVKFSSHYEKNAPEDAPLLALKPFQACILLGFIGTLIILGGTIFMYCNGV